MEYSGLELQYCMELVRRLYNKSNLWDPETHYLIRVSLEQIETEIESIDTQYLKVVRDGRDFRLTESQKATIKHLAFDYLNKGIKINGCFVPEVSQLGKR